MVFLGFEPKNRKIVDADKYTQLWRPLSSIIVNIEFVA